MHHSTMLKYQKLLKTLTERSRSENAYSENTLVSTLRQRSVQRSTQQPFGNNV
jgi:hypothetical protein